MRRQVGSTGAFLVGALLAAGCSGQEGKLAALLPQAPAGWTRGGPEAEKVAGAGIRATASYLPDEATRKKGMDRVEVHYAVRDAGAMSERLPPVPAAPPAERPGETNYSAQFTTPFLKTLRKHVGNEKSDMLMYRMVGARVAGESMPDAKVHQVTMRLAKDRVVVDVLVFLGDGAAWGAEQKAALDAFLANVGFDALEHIE